MSRGRQGRESDQGVGEQGGDHAVPRRVGVVAAADAGDDVFQQVLPAVRGIGVHEGGQGVDAGDVFFTGQVQDAGAESYRFSQ